MPLKKKTADAALPAHDKRAKRIRITLTMVLCLLTLLYGLYCVEHFKTPPDGFSPDESNYIAMAERMISDHIYSFWGDGPDAYVSPGFPVFLFLCMSVFGTGTQALLGVEVVQSVFMAGTVLLTVILGRKLTGRSAVGIFAGVLVAGSLGFYFFVTHLLTEIPYFFFMMLFFVVFYTAVERDRIWLHALAGVCFAAAILIRPLIFIVFPFLYLPSLIRSRGSKHAWLCLGVFALAFAAACLPWWLRNLIVLHKFVLFATQTNPIYAGLAPDVTALGLTDPGSMAGNIKLLLSLLIQDPASTILWMTLGKFQIIFGTPFPPHQGELIAMFVQNTVVFLGLFGGICALFSKKHRGAAVVFWIYLISSFLFVPTSRYALQYIPMLSILTGWLITSGVAQAKSEV